MWAAPLVLGCAALGKLLYKTYEVPGNIQTDTKFLIEVFDDAGDLSCADSGELRAQYNLASILVPGTSPLAYEKQQSSGKFEFTEAHTLAESNDHRVLPTWWQTDPSYKLIQDSDSPLLTGMFIPEIRMNGSE